MEILQRTERSIVRAMCEELLRDIKRSKDLKLVLNETIGQLAMANTAHFGWSCVEEKGWSCFQKGIKF